MLEEADACALLPVRPGDGHKGTFGHVLSVAGSEGMAGAATLCARSALRAGAGLVTAACPFAVLNTVQAQAPCATAKVVADGASLDAGAADMLKELAEHKEALAVGPGLGREEGAWLAIEALVKSDIPKVIDADALFLLAKHGGGVGANTVLTPHPGEMAAAVRHDDTGGFGRARGDGAAAGGGSGRVRAAQRRNDGHRAGRGCGDERHGLRRHGHGRLR